MRVAFTYNLLLNPGSEEEAEFDPPETVEALSDALNRLGLDVEPLEVSGPASRLVARLEALSPDLVFNTAEGRQGRYREAFYPALFEQLGLPYTGSDAYACALTLDKAQTKLLLASNGLPTPRWRFVASLSGWTAPDLRYPVMVKPNFEGSSKGITQDSVIERPEDLRDAVGAMLARYPAGVLVEEYVEGVDVSVPFLEKPGVLTPGEYLFDAPGRRYSIYEFDLKNGVTGRVERRVPAEVPESVRKALVSASRRIVRLLSLHDVARVDFRVSPDGRIHFLDANALPSLEPTALIHKSAALSGLEPVSGVVEAIVRSAAARQGLRISRRSRRRSGLRVGLTYNLKRVKPTAGGDDREAEYDAPATIAALHDALASYGHEVVDLEATAELPALLGASGVDLVFNVAEGIHGRNREAQVPAILELLDIPYTGSDPATLSLTLDKGLAKRVVAQAGLPTARFVVMVTGREKRPSGLDFPLMVKPVAEGSSKGVLGKSVVETEAELREVVAEVVGRYRQGALVEAFLPGREFTVALLGERRPRILPPMEIVFTDPDERRPVYTFEHKLDQSSQVRYEAPARVDAALGRAIERVARGAFEALGCRDVARIDLRCDRDGVPCFIECNPLPGLTPGWSDLCLIAEAAGMNYRTLVGEILAPAIRRFRGKSRGN